MPEKPFRTTHSTLTPSTFPMLEQRHAAAIAGSLDADPELLPFLPELLAGLDALGYPPAFALALVEPHLGDRRDLEMLDLGCGKGACLRAFSKKFKWHGLGVDLFPPFIEDARRSAKREGLEPRLRFTAGDMVATAAASHPVDLVIFGYDSDAFGDLNTTLQAISRPIRPGGHLLLDAAWQNGNLPPTACTPAFHQLETAIHLAGLTSVASKILDPQDTKRINEENTDHIRHSAFALRGRYPEHQALLARYVHAQEQASKVLDCSMINGFMLLKKV